MVKIALSPCMHVAGSTVYGVTVAIIRCYQIRPDLTGTVLSIPIKISIPPKMSFTTFLHSHNDIFARKVITLLVGG